jgi:predicted kinase
MNLSRIVFASVGLPACGKSTVAASWAAADPENRVVVERDAARLSLTGSASDHSREVAVSRLCEGQVRMALCSGKSVFIADTNLAARSRREHGQTAAEFGVPFVLVSFLDVPVSVCVERDSARGAAGGRSAGSEVIEGMAARYSAVIASGAVGLGAISREAFSEDNCPAATYS